MQGSAGLLPHQVPSFPKGRPDGSTRDTSTSSNAQPYWHRLQGLKRELLDLRQRTSTWNPLLAQIGIGALHDRASDILQELEEGDAAVDPTGRTASLREAYAEFIADCLAE